MSAAAAEITELVFGPALPVLDDVAAEFPRWHCWAGLSGLVPYASLIRSSPPLASVPGPRWTCAPAIAGAQAGVRW